MAVLSRRLSPSAAPVALPRDHELRLGVWRAIWLRLSLAVPAETLPGALLVVLEAVLLSRRLPHLRQFFHRYAELPVAGLIGARIGLLLFLMVVTWLVLGSNRVCHWRHADSVEAYSELIRPSVLLLGWISLAQNGVVVAQCAHALLVMLGSSRGRCVQSSFSEVWLCQGLGAWDALPIVTVAATAGLVAAFEATRIGFWKGTLDRLHALDVDVDAAPPNDVLRVPAKRRPRLASEEGTSCCICLSDFEAEEVIAELMCGHSYHEACIRTWLCERDCCPLRCQTGAVRHPIAKGAGLVAGDRVRVRNAAEELWRRGTVASTAPLLVRPDGWLHAHPWELVEPVSGEGGVPARGHEHQD